MNLTIAPLQTADIPLILAWNEGRDAAFLTQWAGSGYRYPLTAPQLQQKLFLSSMDREFSLYKILVDGAAVGTVELNYVAMRRGTAMVCRYLIAEEHTNKGYGTAALAALADLAFNSLKLSALYLKVFDYNKRALRCYEKAGYHRIGSSQWPNGWLVWDMELRRNGGFWGRMLEKMR